MYFLCAYVLQLNTFFQSTIPRLVASISDGVGEGERGGPWAYPPEAYAPLYSVSHAQIRER